MAARLPPDSFEFYYGLGPRRSYAAVAEHYGVAKQTVTRFALKQGWQRLVEERDQQVRRDAARKALESLEELNERHLKMLRAVQGKALEALKALPLSTAMDAVRAIEMSIRQERLIRGEPTEHAAVDARLAQPGPPAPSGQELRSFVRQLVEDAERDGLLGEGGEGE
jgi:hypothetical protein